MKNMLGSFSVWKTKSTILSGQITKMMTSLCWLWKRKWESRLQEIWLLSRSINVSGKTKITRKNGFLFSKFLLLRAECRLHSKECITGVTARLLSGWVSKKSRGSVPRMLRMTGVRRPFQTLQSNIFQKRRFYLRGKCMPKRILILLLILSGGAIRPFWIMQDLPAKARSRIRRYCFLVSLNRQIWLFRLSVKSPGSWKTVTAL